MVVLVLLLVVVVLVVAMVVVVVVVVVWVVCGGGAAAYPAQPLLSPAVYHFGCCRAAVLLLILPRTPPGRFGLLREFFQRRRDSVERLLPCEICSCAKILKHAMLFRAKGFFHHRTFVRLGVCWRSRAARGRRFFPKPWPYG